MGAFCCNLAFIDHDNLVRIEHRTDALGNHKTGSVGHQVIEGSLDLCFRFHVYRAGAVV